MVIAARNYYKSQCGLAYLGVLFLIVAISISLAVVSQNVDLQLKREKEQDWLFVGQQYQRAIGSYYQQSPEGIKVLPTRLEDLLLDKRFIKPVHHLRQLYKDPVNFNQDWQTILNADGQITGVVSESHQAILQTKALADFTDAAEVDSANYADIKFEYKSQAKPNSDQQSEDAETSQGADNIEETTTGETNESE
jgi:hypothetical protein